MSDHPLFMNVIVPYINFAVFLGLLIYFARNKVKEAFAKKRATFESDAEDAAAQFAASERSRNEVKQRLASLDRELAEFESRAVHMANEDTERLLQEAKRMSQNIEGDVSRIIASEIEDAKEEMRVKILEQIKQEVSQEIKKSLSPENQQKFLHKQMTKLSEAGGALT